ncbi:GDP-mannose 4,6-dehydratase [candidate division WOR-3 bacterium]|nr:GDP-mannose 4,6-dehydratase [candidate division WOR-3 bacterium]
MAKKLAVDKKYKVFGTTYSDLIEGVEGVQFQKCDITDFESVKTLVDFVKPDLIYHFAAQSSAGYSFKNPVETFKVNFMGTVNFLEAARDNGVKFFFISSSEVYGDTGNEKAKEEDPKKPLSPYGASKAAAEEAVLQYFRTYGVECCVIRPFPQIGRGQNSRFFIPSVAKQIMEIKKGSRKPVIKTGNLKPKRTYITAEDALTFYIRLIDKAESGEIYNLAGKSDLDLRQILLMMVEKAGVKAQIEQDESFFRASDPNFQLGSSEKIEQLTGFRAEKKIEEELKLILEDYR